MGWTPIQAPPTRCLTGRGASMLFAVTLVSNIVRPRLLGSAPKSKVLEPATVFMATGIATATASAETAVSKLKLGGITPDAIATGTPIATAGLKFMALNPIANPIATSVLDISH